VSDHTENTISNSSAIVTDVLASHRLATASLFIKPFPCNRQCLNSHVTILILGLHNKWERQRVQQFYFSAKPLLEALNKMGK
jgi:hypothetical protein